MRTQRLHTNCWRRGKDIFITDCRPRVKRNSVLSTQLGAPGWPLYCPFKLARLKHVKGTAVNGFTPLHLIFSLLERYSDCITGHSALFECQSPLQSGRSRG